MKKAFASCFGLVLALVLVTGAYAEDKEVTLEGKVTCAKCELGKAKKCTTVIVVKKDDKETMYYFDTAAHKKYHSAVCTSGKKGKVVGVVAKKDGKTWITKVKKVEYEDS